MTSVSISNSVFYNNFSSQKSKILYILQMLCTGCPKNISLTVHYGVEEITVNVKKNSVGDLGFFEGQLTGQLFRNIFIKNVSFS
jgi:hypothetical protein